MCHLSKGKTYKVCVCAYEKEEKVYPKALLEDIPKIRGRGGCPSPAPHFGNVHCLGVLSFVLHETNVIMNHEPKHGGHKV
jgi:hypothetical protein